MRETRFLSLARVAGHITAQARNTPARFAYDRQIPRIIQTARGMRSVAVLDAGCGDGRYARWFSNDHYTGIDPGLEVPEHVVSPTQRFIRCRIEELPFPDGEFDIVFCSLVLEHLADVPRSLASLRRVLKPGGTLLLTTATKHARAIGEMPHKFWKLSRDTHGQAFHYFGVDALVSLHHAAGFSSVDIHFISGPFALALEWMLTIVQFSLMRIRGQKYAHERTSLIRSTGIPQHLDDQRPFIRRVASTVRLVPRFLGNLFCYWVDSQLRTSVAKVVCVVAR